jgi:hypothetical protein
MQEFWGNFVTAFALALIPVVVPIVVGFVKLLFAKAQAELESWSPSFAMVLEQGAKLAIMAAEQANAAKLIEDKKDYAVGVLQLYLDSHGYSTIDLELISAAIEAAVKEAAFPKSKPTAK